ncbi:hypothetical protein BFV94_1916 [Alteromonas macleodii]|uniref:Uncharacterized protein n=1 Tax=Alteromonas macleodii TaxID=28108 RepID=A0AB36FZS9_ALTMA|nr:hypothetical protein BFV95_1915 [Alteromonas macleodii]OES32934.1 hypothetical protein BFV94_1916 [Alteromonas macleodii]OES32982.1 hypothetical protein BFV93_1908 [Alteromonas macleodii]OES41520.1 hypothetical protein BFV96_1916 [Alteromonas macleodii]
MFGLREIHQKHLHADLVFLVNERKRLYVFFFISLLVVV